MSIRFPSDRSINWRLRFLEIAHQAEAVGQRPAMPSGLRPRSRMAGFATLGRARRGPLKSLLA